MQHAVSYCTRLAHDALQLSDLFELSSPSIIGATENSFPRATERFSVAFMRVV
jgi:hypothetical protein